jgi:Glutamine amidotransferases class-II
MMTLEQMNNGIANNRDGCGWAALTTGGELIVRKALDGRAISAELVDLWDDGQIVAWIWHARLATHGSVKVENCHPFISPDGRSAMAHNGIFSIKVPAGRVDSEFYASEVLWKLPVDDLVCAGPVFDTVDAFVADQYSKVAVLTADGSYPLAIFGEALGKWKNGIWFSNESCAYRQFDARPYMYGTAPYALGSAEIHADEDWWIEHTTDIEGLCVFCDKENDIWGFCQSCQCCGICGSFRCYGCSDLADICDQCAEHKTACDCATVEAVTVVE